MIFRMKNFGILDMSLYCFHNFEHSHEDGKCDSRLLLIIFEDKSKKKMRGHWMAALHGLLSAKILGREDKCLVRRGRL